jgi:hypothetical protein
MSILYGTKYKQDGGYTSLCLSKRLPDESISRGSRLTISLLGIRVKRAQDDVALDLCFDVKHI